MERIRKNPIAIEDQTRPDERPMGSYSFKTENPDSVDATPVLPYLNARRVVIRKTQYYGTVTLIGVDPYEPPALD